MGEVVHIHIPSPVEAHLKLLADACRGGRFDLHMKCRHKPLHLEHADSHTTRQADCIGELRAHTSAFFCTEVDDEVTTSYQDAHSLSQALMTFLSDPNS